MYITLCILVANAQELKHPLPPRHRAVLVPRTRRGLAVGEGIHDRGGVSLADLATLDIAFRLTSVSHTASRRRP